MPNDSYYDALKEAYAVAPTNAVVLETLQVTHPSLPDMTIWVVKNDKSLTLGLEDGTPQLFERANFQITKPSAGDNGIQELQLSVDNVDRRVSRFIREAKKYQTPVRVRYRPYVSTDLSTPQMAVPLTLYLKGVSFNDFQVTARASFADLINRRFPTKMYTLEDYPSLGT